MDGGSGTQTQSAMAFYAVIVIATMAGTLLNFTSLNPIKALYWSAVINGIVAVPVMIVMMSMTAPVEVMGKFTVTGGLRWLGWATTIVMGICVVVMGLTWVV